jgi:hypothetical protein
MITAGTETKITATAAQLNGLAVLPLASANIDVANDDITFLDHSDSHMGKYDSIINFVTGLAGGVATTGLSAVTGTLKVDPGDNIMVPAADAFVYMNAAGNLKRDNVADVVALITGKGLTPSAGVISLDPTKIHSELAAGTGKDVAVAIAGMAVGDSIRSVFEVDFTGGTMTDVTSQYTAAATQMTKVGADAVGKTLIVMWIDIT